MVIQIRATRVGTASALLTLAFLGDAGATPASFVTRGFEGTSQLANCELNQCFRPPDTMGAVGSAQFLETTNGSITIYNKASGAVQSRVDMPTFWANAGLPGGAGGDQRVLFDLYTNRWIVTGFGPTGDKINIAVSDTANALGTWRSTQFTGFVAPAGFTGPVADYPTLGMDDKGVYIGTNNFATRISTGLSSFRGTSMFVIPKADLFGGAPTVANMTTFNHAATVVDVGAYGFAMQGAVNWQGNTTNVAPVLASSVIDYNLKFHTLSGVNGPAAVQSAASNVLVPLYGDPQPARQPDGSRVVDTLGDRISANVYQYDGKLFSVHTVVPLGTDYTAVRWTVVDAVTGAYINSGEISEPGYDFYEGSIAVNEYGEVVVGYNRSGGADKGIDGRIGFFLQAFLVDPSDWGLDPFGSSVLMRSSEVDDYHCGARVNPAACRERWGDYSAVTIDPTDHHTFFAIGEYADDWSLLPAQFGVPDERAIWHTYVAALTFVPEPEVLSLLAAALMSALVVRRRRLQV